MEADAIERVVPGDGATRRSQEPTSPAPGRDSGAGGSQSDDALTVVRATAESMANDELAIGRVHGRPSTASPTLNFPGSGVSPRRACGATLFTLGVPLLSQLDQSLAQMAAKNRRLAGHSRLGDDGPLTSLGNPYRRAARRLEGPDLQPMLILAGWA